MAGKTQRTAFIGVVRYDDDSLDAKFFKTNVEALVFVEPYRNRPDVVRVEVGSIELPDDPDYASLDPVAYLQLSLESAVRQTRGEE